MQGAMEEEQTQAASQATFEQRLEVSAPPDGRQTRAGPTGDQEIESDWSDVEERKPVPPTAGAMELEEGPGGEIKSKHEIKLKPFAITETDSQRETRLGITNVQGPLIKVGNLEAVVEDRIIISSVERIVLDIENFLLTKERKIFGTLEDVFGQVERPLYSVLNDQYVKDLFTEGKVKLGDPIFCLSSVMKELNEDRINELKQRKGCDASNKFDEEPLGHRDGEDIYFSDDDLETSTQHRPRKEFIGKRDRELDEEEWSRNKMNKAKVQDLKQKYSNQPPQNQNFQAPTQGLHEYQSHHPSMGHSIAQPAHLGPSQGNVPPQYSNYMAPIIPQLTPEQVLSYNHYLAQINMMYGLPPFAQNNYVQSLNPQPTYLPQDPTQQYSPDFYQNPNQSQQ